MLWLALLLSSLSAAQPAPAPDPASFPAGPDCGAIAAELVAPALQAGLSCLAQHGAAARLAEFGRLLAPGRTVRLSCLSDPAGDYAQAFPSPSRPHVVIGGGVMQDLRTQGPTAELQGMLFHEFVHLLGGGYSHAYDADRPDMAVACDACCFPGSTEAGGYLDATRMTPGDFAAQCRACAEAAWVPDLDYRARMAELALPETGYHLLLGYLRAVIDARLGEEEQRRRLMGSLLPRLCTLEALSESTAPLAPAVRAEILSACPHAPADRPKP